MAAKRVAKTAVDWVAFGERVSPNNLPFFKKFKALNDKYAGRVNQLPESLPKINFNQYKTSGAPANIVDKIEKDYAAAAKVPYPVDNSKTLAKLDEEAADMKKNRASYLAEKRQEVDYLKELGIVCKKAFPGQDEWTLQMFTAYFPDLMPDNFNEPTMWPHSNLMSKSDRNWHPVLERDMPSMWGIAYSKKTTIRYTYQRPADLDDHIQLYTEYHQDLKDGKVNLPVKKED